MNITGADVANLNEARRTKKLNALQRARQWLYMALWYNAKRRFVRWALRVGLFPSSTKTDSDTMGEWKRIQALKDDPKPGLVLPDPNAPDAALIRRVRLYAQNGAKALAPLLDRPLPETDGDMRAGVLDEVLESCRDNAAKDEEASGIISSITLTGGWVDASALKAIHAAYNAPWTVVDGEVYEYESEKRKRVVQ